MLLVMHSGVVVVGEALTKNELSTDWSEGSSYWQKEKSQSISTRILEAVAIALAS